MRHHAPLLDYDRYYCEILRRMSPLDKVAAAAFKVQAKLIDGTRERRLFVGKLNEGGAKP